MCEREGVLIIAPLPSSPPHAISSLLALIIQEEDPVTRIEPEEEEVLLTNMAAKYQTDQVPTVWYVAVPVPVYRSHILHLTSTGTRYLAPYLKYSTIPKYLCTVQVMKFLTKSKITHLLKSTGIDFNLTFLL